VTWEGPEPKAPRVELGLYDTITASIFGKPDADTWRPLSIGTLFSEEWDEAWVRSPNGGQIRSDGLVAPGVDEGVKMAPCQVPGRADRRRQCPRPWQKFGTIDAVSGHDMAVKDFLVEMAEL
jgi:hypothetical protein